MAKASRYLMFEGQFESSVLGTFRIIRGFANLQDLAAISVPYVMEDAGDGAEVKGQQRTLDPQHAERIKRYLESGEPTHPSLCKAEFFIELSARVWKSLPDGDHNERVNQVVTYLEEVASWLGKDGLLELKEGQSLSKQVLNIFEAVRTRIPKRVFLARWYPTAKDGEELETAKLRLKEIKQALKDIEAEAGAHLELVDMGTQTGTTFPIHAKMYEAINSADIILIDLTGVRPNVCVEAGYALRNHEKNRLIFIFQPTEAHKAVPFDLNTFRYEPFKDTGEIPDKIKPHILTILRGAAVGK